MDNTLKFNKVVKTIKKYRKKIVFVGIGIAVIYYLYKRFLSEKIMFLKEIYKKYSDYNEMFKMTSQFENITKQYEGSFNNLILRLLEEIRQKFINEFNINGLFSRIKSGTKEDLPKLWIIFKNKNFICAYCSIFITRCLILFSQTHLLILEKLNMKHNLPVSFYDDLLTELWLMAKDFINYLIVYIENRLNSVVDNIMINQSLTNDQLKQEIGKLREKVEEIFIDREKNRFHFVILEEYFKEIDNKINLLEANTFTNDLKGVKINSFLNFYQVYYDITTSNLFQVIFMKGLDRDFAILEQIIDSNYEEEKKKNANLIQMSVPKIVNFIAKINNEILSNEHTIFFASDVKNNTFQEELNEYFRIIYD